MGDLTPFIDLFCGIGGFRLALEERGLRCVFSSEIDLKTQEAYRENFGESPHGDIREIHCS
jgi:DNA (cytosine-5)-methyltransferase 1